MEWQNLLISALFLFTKQLGIADNKLTDFHRNNIDEAQPINGVLASSTTINNNVGIEGKALDATVSGALVTLLIHPFSFA